MCLLCIIMIKRALYDSIVQVEVIAAFVAFHMSMPISLLILLFCLFFSFRCTHLSSNICRDHPESVIYNETSYPLTVCWL